MNPIKLFLLRKWWSLPDSIRFLFGGMLVLSLSIGTLVGFIYTISHPVYKWILAFVVVSWIIGAIMAEQAERSTTA